VVAYAEVAARSNFSLLDGASHPAEIVATAAALGHAGIGIADANSLAGVVRAHVAAREVGIRFVVGARLVLQDGAEYLAWPTDRPSYRRLTRLLALGRSRPDCLYNVQRSMHRALRFGEQKQVTEAEVIKTLPRAAAR
jgi:error-prone DNA polymerase